MDILYQYYLAFFEKFGIPDFIAIASWYIIPFVLIAIALVISVIVLVLAERKVLALFTIRKGPNRVGFWGCLQTVADAIKLVFKEDIVPKDANKIVFTLAPLIVFIPIMFVWGLIPYSNKFIPLQSNVGFLLFLAVLSVPVLGIVLAGYASNNKYSLIGGMRSAAQVVSYEVPMMLSALSAVILSSSMNINDIVSAQSSDKGLLGWYFIPAFLGFLIFFICTIAEVNRVPFDLPEAESELVSGYNTEYSGIKFALFFLAEYASMFVLSAFTACIFLGGYLPPFGFYLSDIFQFNYAINNFAIYFEQIFWLMLKTCFVVFCIMWIRATLPRLRSDQLMMFAWKFLLPLSILNFFIVCVIKGVALYV